MYMGQDIAKEALSVKVPVEILNLYIGSCIHVHFSEKRNPK